MTKLHTLAEAGAVVYGHDSVVCEGPAGLMLIEPRESGQLAAFLGRKAVKEEGEAR